MKYLFISDIHGNTKALKRLKQIDEYHVLKNKHIFLGDYIDGFKLQKYDVRDVYWQLKFEKKDRGAELLLGNHEDMFLKSFSNETHFRDWLSVGGIETLKSGNIFQKDLYSLTFEEILNKFTTSLGMECFLEDIQSLPLVYDNGKNILAVHAGFDLSKSLENQNREEMLWVRENYFRLQGKDMLNGVHPDFNNKVIVTGHTPNQYITNGVSGDVICDKTIPNVTRYYIDGGSNGSPYTRNQINVLILNSDGTLYKTYALNENGVKETTNEIIYK